jgi:DNA recombination protein RmuC
MNIGITEIAFIIAALLAGIILGWVLAKSRSKQDDNIVIDLKSTVKSNSAVLEETKKQLDGKEKMLEDMHGRVEGLKEDKAIAETRAEEAARKVEEQQRLLDDAKTKMSETFQALSGESLKSNNKAFLELAKESLEVVLTEAKGQIEKKEESIKNVVEPLSEALKRYEQGISEMEKTRASAYGNLESQIKGLLDAQQSLQTETGNLVTALRRPEVRGRWGEVTLKRVVELAGMTAYCDYTEQVSVTVDDTRLRPDMIVHLPSEREIVVDSKVSLDAYIDAMNAKTDEERGEYYAKHARQVRKHMKDLATKAYWEQFEKAPEFVVMFIPAESFLSAAVEKDHALIEDGMESRVIIATPTTLIALLRAIAYGWRQEQVTKNAQDIARIGKELYDRFQPFLEHINKTSNYISQAVTSFNKMVMSLERRVIVSVKKFQELGAAGDKELPEVKQVEQSPMVTTEKQEEQEVD